METEGKRILVNYLTDIADTFRSITGETDTISAESFSKEVQAVATSSSKNSYQRNSIEEMNVINNLYDIKSKGVKTQTLQLGDTNKAKLTAEEIAIATNKGWNVI